MGSRCCWADVGVTNMIMYVGSVAVCMRAAGVALTWTSLLAAWLRHWPRFLLDCLRAGLYWTLLPDLSAFSLTSIGSIAIGTLAFLRGRAVVVSYYEMLFLCGLWLVWQLTGLVGCLAGKCG